jgi:hypothetical protein
LVLRLQHPAAYATVDGGKIVGTFNATVNDQPVRIPYRINNGNGWVYDGDVFATLVRNGGTYKPEQNNGPFTSSGSMPIPILPLTPIRRPSS